MGKVTRASPITSERHCRTEAERQQAFAEGIAYFPCNVMGPPRPSRLAKLTAIKKGSQFKFLPRTPESR